MEGHRTGFFCNVPSGWGILKVLMTNNHVLKEEDILINKTIKFSINNGIKYFEIKIDESRKIYTSKKYDVTIIEIKQNDNIDSNSFFDLDNRIFNENPNELFKNKQIYLLYYPKGKQIEYSIGMIKNICEDNFTLRHLCDSSGGSSGGPIINSLNFHVIGIHKGGAEGAKNYNLGTFLKQPIEEFKNSSQNNKIEMKVNENEIKDIDELVIQYKIENIENLKRIRILGYNFVKNNKDKCQIILNGNQIELCDHLNFDQINNNNRFEIKLKGMKEIINASYMFAGNHQDITPLASLSDISRWNTEKITNISYMFYFCESLSSLPDISNWNTKNVTDISGIFFGCSSLTSLPDISKWNTENVKDMSDIFHHCKLLTSLPDISKWNTENVTYMNWMFGFCSSLSSLPEISTWNTQNVINMENMFRNSSLLQYLPDISKWNIENTKILVELFRECSSLASLPDLSKWNTKNVTNIKYMFKDCSSLTSLPDLSKWNTENVNCMMNLFHGCKSLSSLPDISKWNTKNNKYMNNMFCGCSSLSSLPDISIWNTENVT